jgi:hypothetical protein
MNTFILRKAERKQAKLRIGLSSPSGGGKTYSALLLAYGITGDWSKVALIDTEAGSGELYSHLGDYNVVQLDAPYSPERYIEYIKGCEDAGMEVIVIDSTSHEWEGKGGCLEINETIAQAKFRGNTWSAWSETTPRHQKFIQAIVTSKCHIITATRNKIDTVMTEDKKVKKVGTKEIQREGFEYELTVNFNIDRDTHKVIASKDRTNLFEGQDPFIITPDTGKKLIEWAMSGVEVETPTPTVTKKDVANYAREQFVGIKDEDIRPKIVELTGLDPAKEEPVLVLEALKKALTPVEPAKKSLASKIAKATKK